MSFIVPKGKTGVPRLLEAAVCALKGLTAAFRHEDAFRMEVLAAVVLIPAALMIRATALERALLVGSVLLVLVVELMNSAIEATVDRISLDRHPLAARAKDIGSAAVLVSILNAASVWLLLLLA